MRGWTQEDLNRLALKHATKPTKGRKYRNQPTEIDGVTFASKREAARYEALKVMQAAGEISGLELQPQFPMLVARPDGVTVAVGSYRADFRYIRDNQTVIEDAKGMKTEPYKMRKRHVEAQYGIRIEEV